MQTGTRLDGGRHVAGFSIASFAAGLVVGAAVAVVAVYVVGGDADGPSDAPAEPRGAVDVPEFQFWDRLPNAWVAPDTAPYEQGGAARPAPRPRTEFLLQAGAFHREEAAEQRRAELLLAGMRASVSTVGVDDGVLYRVVVGPYQSRSETHAATRQLRDRNIAPVLLERPAPAG